MEKTAWPAESPDDDAVAPDNRAVRGPRTWFATLLAIPLPFLGFGLYRGWLSVLFENGLTQTAGFIINQNVFDIAMATVCLACALFSKRLTPLYTRRWPVVLTACLCVGTSLLGFVFRAFPVFCLPSALLYMVTGGVGGALLFLLWLELYGLLSPTRLCLYYAASIAVGAGIGWLYQGFDPAVLPVAAALLPLASLRCLHNCHTGGQVAPVGELRWAEFSFPWKPVLVILAYSLAYSLLQSTISPVAKQVTSPGSVLGALAVIAIITVAINRWDFGTIYGLVLPCMAATLLVAGAVLCRAHPWSANLCANWGYVVGQMFITTMLGTICYHWGASALWLFGLEQALHLLVMTMGRLFDRALGQGGTVTLALAALLALCATVLVIRERRLSSNWGISFADVPDNPLGLQRARAIGSITNACAELARRFGLSQREEEVLLLLAQHRTAREIEQELCVANGTAKAHVRHVYQKLGIHTREALFDLVEGARR